MTHKQITPEKRKGFVLALDKAATLFDALATGHYIKVEKPKDAKNIARILRAIRKLLVLCTLVVFVLACGVTLPVPAGPAGVNTYAEPYRRATLATAPNVEAARVQMDMLIEAEKMQEWNNQKGKEK